MIQWLKKRLSRVLIQFLEKPSRKYNPYAISNMQSMRKLLQPGDVLLVEGNLRFSVAVKYLTQSTWSHSAIYVGEGYGVSETGEPNVLVEADISQGVIAVPLSKYKHYNTRICRPVNLQAEDQKKLIEFVVQRIGYQYDMKNVFDLVRYLLLTPPIPVHLRRRMLALGSGDPTRAICSTLIAEAFQSIRYPILPLISFKTIRDQAKGGYIKKEIMHIRHHSLYTPRDFDISPYFKVIKPTIESGFNYKKLEWKKEAESDTWIESAPRKREKRAQG